MLSAVEVLARIRAALRTSLYRNECRQTDRAWYGSMSLWINVVIGWLVVWGLTLGLLWMAGPHWWLATVPLMLVLTQLLALSSAPDMAVLLQRERRERTIEILVLTTADRRSLLWAKLATALRANVVLSLSYLPLGLVAGALVWARDPESAGQALWVYGLGGLALGALACVVSLGGALTAATVGAWGALSRRRFIWQLVLAVTLTIPLTLLDLICIAAPMAGLLAAWRSSLPAFPLTSGDYVLGNLLDTVGLAPEVLRSVGLPVWLLCGAGLVILRLLFLNLWLPLRLMRRCAERFDERMLRGG